MNPFQVAIDSNGFWRQSLSCMCALVCVYAVTELRKLIGWPIAILLGYLLAQGIYNIEYPDFRYGEFSPAFYATAGSSLFEILLLFVFCLMIYKNDKHVKYFRYSLVTAFTISCVHLFKEGYGFMLSPSFDTASLALVLPMSHVSLMMVYVAAILSRHGSTACLMLVLECYAFALVEKGFRLLALIFTPFIVAAAALQSDKVFNSTERLLAWKRYMTTWIDGTWFDHLFGFGHGSFIHLSMIIDKYKEPIFLQMHNDWLQILFEHGIVGLCLAFNAYLWTLFTFYKKNDRMFVSTVGLGAFMLTYHPLRFAPTMLIIAYIFIEALRIKNAEPQLRSPA